MLHLHPFYMILFLKTKPYNYHVSHTKCQVVTCVCVVITNVRMRQKLNVLTFKCLHGDGPAYLSSLLEAQQPSRTLRSQDVRNLKVPLTRSKFGQRSFSSAAPVLWNSLPVHLKNESDLGAFKQNLKTHLFQLAYEC